MGELKWRPHRQCLAGPLLEYVCVGASLPWGQGNIAQAWSHRTVQLLLVLGLWWGSLAGHSAAGIEPEARSWLYCNLPPRTEQWNLCSSRGGLVAIVWEHAQTCCQSPPASGGQDVCSWCEMGLGQGSAWCIWRKVMFILFIGSCLAITICCIPWTAIDGRFCPSHTTVWAGLAESAGRQHKAHRGLLCVILISNLSCQAAVMVSDDLVKLQDIHSTVTIYVQYFKHLLHLRCCEWHLRVVGGGGELLYI